MSKENYSYVTANNTKYAYLTEGKICYQLEGNNWVNSDIQTVNGLVNKLLEARNITSTENQGFVQFAIDNVNYAYSEKTMGYSKWESNQWIPVGGVQELANLLAPKLEIKPEVTGKSQTANLVQPTEFTGKSLLNSNNEISAMTENKSSRFAKFHQHVNKAQQHGNNAQQHGNNVLECNKKLEELQNKKVELQEKYKIAVKNETNFLHSRINNGNTLVNQK